MTTVERPRATYRQVFAVRRVPHPAGRLRGVPGQRDRADAGAVRADLREHRFAAAGRARLRGRLPAAGAGRRRCCWRWPTGGVRAGCCSASTRCGCGRDPAGLRDAAAGRDGAAGLRRSAGWRRSPTPPGRAAAGPARGDRYVLGRSLFTVVSAGMQVVGAAVGGLLLALVGPAGALWLTASVCVVSAGDPPVRPGRPAGPGHRAAAPGRSAQTWRVNRLLLADPAVRGLLLAQWLPGVLMVAAEGVVVPYAAGLGRGVGGRCAARRRRPRACCSASSWSAGSCRRGCANASPRGWRCCSAYR